MILVWYIKEINKYKKGYPRSRGANMAPQLDKRKTDAKIKIRKMIKYIDAKAGETTSQEEPIRHPSFKKKTVALTP